jgi:uncharacterized membrane protein HdeD (DUF308 family)
MVMRAWRRWQDYATIVFGVLLFASPFVLAPSRTTTVTAFVLGGLLVVAGVVAASTSAPRRSLIVNAPGLVAVITLIAALVLGFWNLDHEVPSARTEVAWTAGVMAVATLVAGATLRLSGKE